MRERELYAVVSLPGRDHIGGIPMSEKNQNDYSQHSGGRSRQGRQMPKSRSGGRGIAVRVGKVVGTLLLIGLVTGAFMACYAAVYIRTVIMPRAAVDLSAYTLNENSVIYYYDKNTGQPVVLQTLSGAENREWVDFEDIPKDLVNAFVAIEDKRFLEHGGVDWYRTASAFLNMFVGMRNTYGASTITQQLIKNVTEYDDVTVTRKILEIFTALEVEKDYEKEDILEYYMNEIFLGNGCYGVQTASRYYFGKDVSQLSLAECASLAGITNNPSLYSPYGTVNVTRYPCKACGTYSLDADKACQSCGAHDYGEGEVWTNREFNKARQETILWEMAKPKDEDPYLGYITKEEYEQAIAEPLVFARDLEDNNQTGQGTTTPSSAKYSWYVEAVIRQVTQALVEETGLSEGVVRKMVFSGGLSIYVPYDPEVQAAVDQIYNDPRNLNYTSSRGQRLQSAITVVDNDTGYVVAMGSTVNKTGDLVSIPPMDAVRQPGSSIKPLSVYAPALEMGLITPASVSDDNPRLLNGRPYPTNAPVGYRGLTTIMDAVTRSVNTVALNVLEQVTTQVSYDFMTQRFGFTSLKEEDSIYKGNLSMGGLRQGLSTFEMAAAYATFPRNGAFTKATTFLKVEDVNHQVLLDNTQAPEHIIKESTAYYINTMLTNVVSAGTGTRARIPGQTVAGKTGTTNDTYDLWFAGYTSHYTAAVWTGYENNEMINLTLSPSITLWQKVMAIIHQGLENKAFPVPSQLNNYATCADSGLLATSYCARDIRGDRTRSFRLRTGDAPTERCNLHVPVSVCVDSPVLSSSGETTGLYHLATEFCPEESIREISMLDYQRELVSSSVWVQDQSALMSVYLGMADPDCHVHTERGNEPPPSEDPDNSDEPTAPPSPEPTAPPVQESDPPDEPEYIPAGGA